VNSRKYSTFRTICQLRKLGSGQNNGEEGLLRPFATHENGRASKDLYIFRPFWTLQRYLDLRLDASLGLALYANFITNSIRDKILPIASFP